MMNLTLTDILTIVTVIISLLAFSNRNLFEKLILSPYLAFHHRQWYRIITHAFIHADWGHLLFNMLALWSFGQAVEIYFAQITTHPGAFYLGMYFAAIIVSSLFDIIKKKDNPNYLTLGASGAVSAVIFSAIFFDPWRLIYIFFIPCPGILFGVVYLVYCQYMSRRGGDGINHNAHFYGSVFGFIFPILLEPRLIFYFIYQLMHPSFL